MNPAFSVKHKARIESLRAYLGGASFFTASPADIFYFSGCSGSNNFLLVSPTRCLIFTDGRYLTQIQGQSKIKLEIVELKPGFDLAQALSQNCIDIPAVLFNPESMSFLSGQKMMEGIGFSKISMDNATVSLRAQKDEEEIALLRSNLKLTAEAFLAVKERLHPKMTELQAAAELEYLCKSLGADGMSFVTIILTGERSAMPHGKPSAQVLGRDAWIQFDFGIIKEGYCSDFSRTTSLGTPPAKLLEAHDLVRRTVDLVLEQGQCGMTGKEIDAIARNFIHSEGFGDAFNHGLGHGIGISVHENPMLNADNTSVILENSVFTIEPGLYFPGLGGVRLEEVAVMRRSGIELLTDCPL